PEDELQPILFPRSYSLGDFLRNTTGVQPVRISDLLFQVGFSSQNRNHCILVQAATYWCPDREEHGYFLTLVFKCTTNPPVFTAHRWKLAVDVLDRMREPTKCLYFEDEKWCYADTHRAFRTDDLTTSEWELLSTSTTQFLIKKPAGRKSASPQNTYEAYQLYGAGALRAWCVGLRHIVFNNVYRDILEYS
ncbi:hypothetical protein EDD16DRAFT_1451564, partial [Pisolithus croceorrhizus]